MLAFLGEIRRGGMSQTERLDRLCRFLLEMTGGYRPLATEDDLERLVCDISMSERPVTAYRGSRTSQHFVDGKDGSVYTALFLLLKFI